MNAYLSCQRAGLRLLLLFLAAAVLPTAASAASPSKPKKITGRISYRENGPIAFAGGGFAVSMLMGPQAGAIALGRMKGLVEAILKNPAAAGKDPSSKSLNALGVAAFPQGVVLGLTTLYTADASFQLVLDPKDPSAFVLDSGTVRWSASNNKR